MRKRNNSAEDKPRLRDKTAETLGVSKEVILDLPRLVFIGNRELTVENYKSIGEYTQNLILLDANQCKLKISGEALEIKSIASELIYICGKIFAVEFKREG